MYGHALALLALPCCVVCDAPGATTVADDGRALCARCNLIEEVIVSVQGTPELFVQRVVFGRGYQIKCSQCGCSVRRQHVPNSDDCLQSRLEREWSMADE